MILLILEAFLALFILVGIVWWTMFSGRKGGEINLPAKGSDMDEKHPPSS